MVLKAGQPPKILSPIRNSKDLVRIVTVVNAVQFWKVSSPMASTDSGKSIDGRLVHHRNDLISSSTTLGGMGTLINASHLPKQYLGIRSNVGGNVADDNSVQLLKAPSSISTIVPVVDGSKTDTRVMTSGTASLSPGASRLAETPPIIVDTLWALWPPDTPTPRPCGQ